MEKLTLCPGSDPSALDRHLTGHLWHCPKCNRHLTSLYLCPRCGTRYEEPGPEALARLLAELVPEPVLRLAAELALSKEY